MKTLYLIGGPMGVGKSAVGRYLKERTRRCVLLDGDWCWEMNPFQVTDETRAMVMDNICHLLNNFLACSAIDAIFFCWVLHRQEIIDELLSRLDISACRVVSLSLTCEPDTLAERLRGDVARGLRAEDVVARALAYLPLYDALATVKLDVTDLRVAQTAQAILAL